MIDASRCRVDGRLMGELHRLIDESDGALERELRFNGATIECKVEFSQVTFKRRVSCTRATFEDRVSFSGVTFLGDARFERARFLAKEGPIGEDGERQSASRFIDCVFDRRALFDSAEFSGRTTFVRSTFGQHVRFGGVRVASDLGFNRVIFERSRNIGRIRVDGQCRFDFATFERSVTVDVEKAQLVNFGGTLFREGLNLRVLSGDVVVENSRFGAPSTIAIMRPAGLVSDTSAERLRREARREGAPPRLVSLRGSSINRLTVSGLDMRPCLFTGAHELEGLSVDSSVILGEPPRSGSLMPPRRWIRRDVIAEERHWRHATGKWPEWDVPEEYQPPADLAREKTPPTAVEVAEVYRALRRGREQSKNEPGAADFYYGEMEMRRHAHLDLPPERARIGRGERWLVTAYWAVAGYALRPIRAALALALVIAVFAALLALVGVTGGNCVSRALRIALESATLRPGGQERLTEAGRWLQLPLRLLGPLLLGLILLSFRNRVRR